MADGKTAQNLDLMQQIEEQFLETPFLDVRQKTWHLRNDGLLVAETDTSVDAPDGVGADLSEAQSQQTGGG